ncbi:MAG: NifB/NifX family molybdenum-iron cluster-binding protein [Oscillospiraceae bacterium]
MIIAVTYDMGQIFQHFGHTEYFALYSVENGEVRNSEIVSANGSGHGALAEFLAQKGVDVLICGGIGGGAVNALAQQGIELVAGAQGSAAAAVKAYLEGKLVSAGANCDHHDHDHGEHSCGHDCGNH